MHQSYPISPRVAEQAARNYLVIKRAGLLWELEREIEQTIEAHLAPHPDAIQPWSIRQWDAYRARSLDQWRNGGAHQLQAARGYARELADLLDCPQSAVEPFIVPEQLGDQTRRAIVLGCLRSMANYARKAGRRSA